MDVGPLRVAGNRMRLQSHGTPYSSLRVGGDAQLVPSEWPSIACDALSIECVRMSLLLEQLSGRRRASVPSEWPVIACNACLSDAVACHSYSSHRVGSDVGSLLVAGNHMRCMQLCAGHMSLLFGPPSGMRRVVGALRILPANRAAHAAAAPSLRSAMVGYVAARRLRNTGAASSDGSLHKAGSTVTARLHSAREEVALSSRTAHRHEAGTAAEGAKRPKASRRRKTSSGLARG